MFENGIFDAILYYVSGLSVKLNNAFLKNSYANKTDTEENKNKIYII